MNEAETMCLHNKYDKGSNAEIRFKIGGHAEELKRNVPDVRNSGSTRQLNKRVMAMIDPRFAQRILWPKELH